MSEQPAREHGAGKTGGLPGANADPVNAELTDDERASTVDLPDTPRERDQGSGAG